MKPVVPLSRLLQPTNPPTAKSQSAFWGAPDKTRVIPSNAADISSAGQSRARATAGPRVADRGEAEARLLFARSQIVGEPARAMAAQANLSRAASRRLLTTATTS